MSKIKILEYIYDSGQEREFETAIDVTDYSYSEAEYYFLIDGVECHFKVRDSTTQSYSYEENEGKGNYGPGLIQGSDGSISKSSMELDRFDRKHYAETGRLFPNVVSGSPNEFKDIPKEDLKNLNDVLVKGPIKEVFEAAIPLSIMEQVARIKVNKRIEYHAKTSMNSFSP